MTRIAGIARQLVVPAAFAAALVSTVDLARSSLEGALLIVALLLPLAFVWVLVGTLLRPWVARLAAAPSLVARLLVVSHVGGVLLALGGFAADLFMRDWPLGPHSRIVLSATVVVALVGMWLSRSLFAPAAQQLAMGRATELVGALLMIDGLGLALFDEFGIGTEKYLHSKLFNFAFALLTIGMTLLIGRRHSSRLNRASALVVVAALLVALVPRDRMPLYNRVAGSHGMHGRILAMARSFVDRDDDGYSALLGGGDCDDRDPHAYPLSSVRDCLGWRERPWQKTPYLPEVRAKADAPRLILFLTIDAFRCGFGAGEEPALRDACPNLTRLASQGQARLDAHSGAASTSAAITIMMTGNPNADPIHERHRKRPTLVQRLHDAGYRTEVLMTFADIVVDQATHDSFDEVNAQLRSFPQSTFRGEELTALTLQRARTLLDSNEHAFLWAHYPDPHFPYTFATEPWKRSSLEDYARVVKRTDKVIGELIDGVAQLPNAGDVLVVITADHGEEFAHEHGERFHGFTLYEPVVRVPIIAWTPVAHRRFVDAPPPATTAQLAQYLLNAVGEPLEPQPAPANDPGVLLRTVMIDREFGVVSNAWKLIYNASRNTTELFDLRRDPGERENLASREGAKVKELGQLLGGMLSPRLTASAN